MKTRRFSLRREDARIIISALNWYIKDLEEVPNDEKIEHKILKIEEAIAKRIKVELENYKWIVD